FKTRTGLPSLNFATQCSQNPKGRMRASTSIQLGILISFMLLYFTGNIPTRSTSLFQTRGTCVFKIRTPSDVIGNNPHLFSSENLPSAVDTLAVFLGEFDNRSVSVGVSLFGHTITFLS